MKVKWTEKISNSKFENIEGMYPDEANPSDFDQEYTGEIIGTNKGFVNTYLVVACTDGKIRECNIDNVEIIGE